MRLLVLALLVVLGEDRKPANAEGGLWHAVTEALRGLCDMYDKSSWEPMHAVDRYFDSETGNPLAGVVALLAEFGSVTGDVGKPVITPLGRWAAGHLSVGLPALADPELPVGRGSGRARPAAGAHDGRRAGVASALVRRGCDRAAANRRREGHGRSRPGMLAIG